MAAGRREKSGEMHAVTESQDQAGDVVVLAHVADESVTSVITRFNVSAAVLRRGPKESQARAAVRRTPRLYRSPLRPRHR